MPDFDTRPKWKPWLVCGLLLLATTINYMDRQTLANAASRVIEDFQLSKEQYGEIEWAFGVAFAIGSLVFGFLADKVNVLWLYPAVVLLWSAMGFATGLVYSFSGLLICRGLLGLFEAGHWPCALTTTQRLLAPKDRTLGNSILQSGASIGAIITPIILIRLLTPEEGSWRFAFQAVGAVGLIWVLFWFLVVRKKDLQQSAEMTKHNTSKSLSLASWIRRSIVLVVVVIAINMHWQLFRVWLTLFLKEGRGYSQEAALGFTSVFYVASDVGCFAAGAATVLLHRRGFSAGWSRWWVFVGCSILTALSVVLSQTPAGPMLTVLLCLIAAGSLGIFPCYYALSQELSSKHQGKITGILGAFAWFTTSPIHKYFGRLVDTTKSYDLGIAVVGCLPLIAAIFWLAVWDWGTEERRNNES
jgi:MFS transporter, ACS family, hexuronate transporter